MHQLEQSDPQANKALSSIMRCQRFLASICESVGGQVAGRILMAPNNTILETISNPGLLGGMMGLSTATCCQSQNRIHSFILIHS